MRTFQYSEYTEPPGSVLITVTEEQILEIYWDYWVDRILEANKDHLICKENCIQDFITINWAWEI